MDRTKKVYGIQGGKGSFNEEAVLFYLKKKKIKNFKIKYLHTTLNVLRALDGGEVSTGQFAIHNSLGGVVTESTKEMSKYRFRVVDGFSIKISHALMMRSDAKLADIKIVMTHPQVLAQCKSNIAKKYPQIKFQSGKGELIDHAKVAEMLGSKILPKSVATMGSVVLARVHGLKVIENNLEDLKENYTSFLVVEKI